MTGNAPFHDYVDVALDPQGAFATITALRAALDRAEARVANLEAALRPFGDEADAWGHLVPDDHAPLCVEMGHTDGRYYGSAAKYTVGDLRRARAALADKGGE